MRSLPSALTQSTLLHVGVIAALLAGLATKIRLGATPGPGVVEIVWSGSRGEPTSRSTKTETIGKGPTTSPHSGAKTPPTSAGQQGLQLHPHGDLLQTVGTPDYPTLSRKNGEEGQVTLQFMLADDGTAHDVTVTRSSGHPRLDQAAVNFLQSKPLKLGSDSVIGTPLSLSFVFSLKN